MRRCVLDREGSLIRVMAEILCITLSFPIFLYLVGRNGSGKSNFFYGTVSCCCEV